MTNQSISLLDIIGEVGMTNYCVSSDGRYSLWESETAQPRLEELGYTTFSWFTGERDSFGPLTRVVTCFKEDQSFKFVYG